VGATFRVLSMIVLLAAVSWAQSLGDVARQQKQKQQAKTGKPAPKVITDDDLPSHPNDSVDSKPAKDSHEEVTSTTSGDKKPAAQWKAEIQAQKDNIASMQAQLDRVKASIYFVEANRYVNGVEYNQQQIRKQQQAERMQKQLDEQKSRLESMQEAARRQGYGSAVYDP